MMPSNKETSALIGAEMGGSAALQEPQRPVSAKWSNATRFFVLQAGQERIIDWLITQLDARTLAFVAPLFAPVEPLNIRAADAP
jgi:hypothetical protein